MPQPKYFGVEYPKLKLRWHSALNAGIDPDKLISRNPTKYWWTCEKGHDYQGTIRSVIDGRACRICIGTEIRSGVNDFKTLYPKLARDWHPTKNGHLKPDQIGVGSKTKIWWKCANGHEYTSDIWGKIQGKRCRACAGLIATPGRDDFPAKYPELIKFLDVTKNPVEKLKGLHPGSESQFFWICPKGHTWKQSPREIVKKKKGKCSYCSNNLVWEGFNDLATRKPSLAKEWDFDKNPGIDPKRILFQTDSLFYWKCLKHGHSWRTSPYKRIHEKSNCPYCSNHKVLRGFNDLATKEPALSAEWNHKRNSRAPMDVVFGSHDKYWWKCLDGHEWEATLSSRITRGGRRGAGCPRCAKSGFDPGMPAILYFIENKSMNAFKIGITNVGTIRLKGFIGNGWAVHFQPRFETGADARSIEKSLQSWLKFEMNLAPVLTRGEIGKLGGETETFSNSAITKKEVLERIRFEMDALGILSRK